VWADAVARRVEAEQARVVELEAAHAAERDALAAEHVEAERALEAMQATLKEERAAVAAEREALSQERGAVPPRATGAAATDADLNHRIIMAIQVDPLLLFFFVCAARAVGASLEQCAPATGAVSPPSMHETCPVSTGRRTRRVHIGPVGAAPGPVQPVLPPACAC